MPRNSQRFLAVIITIILNSLLRPQWPLSLRSFFPNPPPSAARPKAAHDSAAATPSAPALWQACEYDQSRAHRNLSTTTSQSPWLAS